MLTAELIDSFTELRLSPQGTSFVTDGIILRRYVELDATIHRVMTVIKMRARRTARNSGSTKLRTRAS